MEKVLLLGKKKEEPMRAFVRIVVRVVKRLDRHGNFIDSKITSLVHGVLCDVVILSPAT